MDDLFIAAALTDSDIANIVLLTNNHELKPNPNKTKLIIIVPITN